MPGGSRTPRRCTSQNLFRRNAPAWRTGRRTMTDGPRAGPPQKRECRPGQEAAPLGETGKVNGVNNATNSVALSSKIDAAAAPIPDRREFEQWLADHSEEFFPALLPDGSLSDCRREWC